MAKMLESGESAEDAAADAARERELAAVSVDAADVGVVMAEFEVTKEEADRALRLARGDLGAALTALVSQ